MFPLINTREPSMTTRTSNRNRWGIAAGAAFACAALTAPAAVAGSPFETGDPSIAEMYELKTTYQQKRSEGSRQIVAPKFSFTVPVATDWEASAGISEGWRRKGSTSTHGLRDTTVATKWRFFNAGADSWLPDLAIEPEFAIPTGSERKGLGERHARFTLPLYLGKTFGRFGVAAEIGYSRSLGRHADDEMPYGFLVTYKVSDELTVGSEVAGSMPRDEPDSYDLSGNVGAKWKVASGVQLQGLVGRSLAGPNHGPSAFSKLVLKLEF
jgi:hypothetical protein